MKSISLMLENRRMDDNLSQGWRWGRNHRFRDVFGRLEEEPHKESSFSSFLCIYYKLMQLRRTLVFSFAQKPPCCPLHHQLFECRKSSHNWISTQVPPSFAHSAHTLEIRPSRRSQEVLYGLKVGRKMDPKWVCPQFLWGVHRVCPH